MQNKCAVVATPPVSFVARFLSLCLVAGMLFIGQASADSWKPVASTSPGTYLDTMLLLTDGSIMILSADDNQTWLKLTPDSHGSYLNGTWSVLGKMGIPRLYFAAQVLQSGKVWVLGGEYTGPYYDSNIDPSAEIYDPIANSWSAAATFPNQPSCSRRETVTSDVSTTSGSPIVTGIYSTARMQVGWTVTGGSGLTGAAIVSIDSPTQVTLNKNATATGPVTQVAFKGLVTACFGDDPSILLPGGNILAGSILSNVPEIYSIAGDSWSPAGAKVFSNERGDEEGWAVLDDNRVLTYDIFKSISAAAGYAEIYTPSTNSWASISPSDSTANGTLPILSSSALGDELGPLLRLQDGRILVIGANQHTALYTPSTNTWAAGPDLLATLSNAYGSINNALFGADDAPAAELPNGHVITAADAGPNLLVLSSSLTSGSPTVTLSSTAGLQPTWPAKATGIPSGTTILSVDSATQITLSANATSTATRNVTYGGTFSPPTQLFDFNPSTGTATPIATADDATLAQLPSFVLRMLVLPTGQLLLNDDTNQLWVYTPDGTTALSARPTVNGVVKNGDGSYTLTGKQLNGQSAGAAYGDDVQMDENHPIVRLQSVPARGVTCDPDGGVCNVYYARTTNWSSVAVGGGATPQTVNFTLPAGIPAGTYTLTVTGAGVTSLPVAFSIH